MNLRSGWWWIINVGFALVQVQARPRQSSSSLVSLREEGSRWVYVNSPSSVSSGTWPYFFLPSSSALLYLPSEAYLSLRTEPLFYSTRTWNGWKIPSNISTVFLENFMMKPKPNLDLALSSSTYFKNSIMLSVTFHSKPWFYFSEFFSE